MKPRSQAATEDGFDTNVAQKMPGLENWKNLRPSIWSRKPPQQEKEDDQTVIVEPFIPETRSSEKQAERKVVFQSLPKGVETEQSLDVLKLIEDLHAQLVASAQTKRALETDLASYRKSIHQLAQDNQELRRQWEALSKEDQKLKELRDESTYLQEEHADALERIKEFQQELREMKKIWPKPLKKERKPLIGFVSLESQMEQSEVIKMKGKLKEREASLFSEENRELQSKLGEALARNADLEKKYETLKKSFGEVRESLTFLRDSCKANYYNLPETAD